MQDSTASGDLRTDGSGGKKNKQQLSIIQRGNTQANKTGYTFLVDYFLMGMLYFYCLPGDYRKGRSGSYIIVLSFFLLLFFYNLKAALSYMLVLVKVEKYDG